jgi:PAS domain S-box-containing protein
MTSNRAADHILGVDHPHPAHAGIEEAFPGLVGSELPGALRRIARTGGVYENNHLLYTDRQITCILELHAFPAGTDQVGILFRSVAPQRIEELDKYFALGLDPLCIMDTDVKIRRVNSEWEAAFGWTSDDLLGKPLLDFIHPEDVASTRAAMQLTREQNRMPHLVNRLRCRDGSFRWTEWRATVEGALVYAVARDVSERVKLRERITEREELLASIFRAAPVGIGMALRRVVGEANDHLCEMTGYSREEIIGLPTRRFYANAEEYARTGEILGHEEIARGFGTTETRWVRKDGSVFDIFLGTAPLVTGDLSSGVTFTALDITERRRAEADRHALEKRMLQTQKLESLGVLAGGIAHDFNNILMAVLGHADLAQAQLPPLSPAAESLEEIEKAARRAADLCRQMLAYSGKGHFVIQPLDINEVIHEMEHMLQVSVSKKAIFRFMFTPSLPPVEGDIAQLRQVIMNLIINASEALDDANGLINIATGAQDCDAAYLRTTSLDEELSVGRYVFLEVSDNGKGMDGATQRRIFEPFFTTKFTGRGLGLAAVQGIVRGHKGAIKVYSEPGKGSTFKVLFPASPAQASHLTAPSARPVRWKGSGTVLLADDEESVRSVGKKMLERMGFTVLLAADGKQAVSEFAQHRKEIVCVIMDLTMPEMDGEEAFREIRRIDPRSRVLLSSGYNEQEAVQRFMGKGLAGFLQKPYQMAILEEKLRDIIGNS